MAAKLFISNWPIIRQCKVTTNSSFTDNYKYTETTFLFDNFIFIRKAVKKQDVASKKDEEGDDQLFFKNLFGLTWYTM